MFLVNSLNLGSVKPPTYPLKRDRFKGPFKGKVALVSDFKTLGSAYWFLVLNQSSIFAQHLINWCRQSTVYVLLPVQNVKLTRESLIPPDSSGHLYFIYSKNLQKIEVFCKKIVTLLQRVSHKTDSQISAVFDSCSRLKLMIHASLITFIKCKVKKIFKHVIYDAALSTYLDIHNLHHSSHLAHCHPTITYKNQSGSNV